MMIELEYKGLKHNDWVEVTDDRIMPNCDGWGRDLPANPWRCEQHVVEKMYGRVVLKVWEGHAELMFENFRGWNRSLSSFAEVKKLTEEEAKSGHEHTDYYEIYNGKRVPLGTAEKEYCKSRLGL